MPGGGGEGGGGHRRLRLRGARVESYAHLDAANIDLKAFSEEFYRHTCGARLEAVKDTLRYVSHETSVWFEITNLLIPGLNDSDEELHAMTSWIVDDLGPDVPVHLTAFHPDFTMTDRERTPPETLTRARRIARENGVRFAYTGNVHDCDGSSTYCPGCATVVVERDWYEIGAYRLSDEGRCHACGTPGVELPMHVGRHGRRSSRVVGYGAFALA